MKLKKILSAGVVALCVAMFGLFTIHNCHADTTNSVVVYLGQPGGTYVYLDGSLTNAAGFSNGVPCFYSGNNFSSGLTTNLQVQSIVFSTGLHATNTLVIKNGIIVGTIQGP